MKTEVSRTKIDWHAHLRAHEQSALTAKAYCQGHQLNYDHFCYRKRKQKSLSAPVEFAETQTGFVPVAVNATKNAQLPAAFRDNN